MKNKNKMLEKFKSRKVKITIVSIGIGNVDIYIESKRCLLYYSNNKTSDELWESYSDVLRILSSKIYYKTAKAWWKKQFSPSHLITNKILKS